MECFYSGMYSLSVVLFRSSSIYEVFLTLNIQKVDLHFIPYISLDYFLINVCLKIFKVDFDIQRIISWLFRSRWGNVTSLKRLFLLKLLGSMLFMTNLDSSHLGFVFHNRISIPDFWSPVYRCKHSWKETQTVYGVHFCWRQSRTFV